jgi:D-alanyl-D-alanine carboxypeptidase
MEAVAAVEARIAQIQSRIAQIAPHPTTSFETVLGAAVLGELGPTAGSSFASPSLAALGLGATMPGLDVVGSGKALVDAKGVPLELRAYGNGRIPSSALSQIAGTSHQLWAPAARSFEALLQAARADGVSIGITDSYRTYETQVDLVRRKGLYSQGGLAAAPGTSMHGWGVAVDLSLDAGAQAWMRENAGRFGFVENVAREPWHWQYVPTH